MNDLGPLLRRGSLVVAMLILAFSLATPKHPNFNNLPEPISRLEATGSYFAYDSPFIPPQTLGMIISDGVFDKYANEWHKGIRMSDLLDCLWLNESSRGKNMYGDYWNGKPLAYGHYQIQIWQHPEVSYECAMDLECSTKYTVAEIKAERGWQWTPYEKCIKSLTK